MRSVLSKSSSSVGTFEMETSNDFYLLIDDIRDQYEVERVARTADQGKLCLMTLPVTHLLIDHDLGEQTSGYDIINWAIEHDVLPPKVFIVSANPVGRNNIGRALLSAGYKFQISGWYHRD